MSNAARLKLSPEQVRQIHHAWDAIRQNLRGFAVQFYMDLFLRYPELESRFTGDFNTQANAFAAMLDLLVRAVDEPEMLAARLPALARRHQALGISEEDFEKFGNVLIDAMMRNLPPNTGAALRSTLREMYLQISQLMEKPWPEDDS